MIKEESNDGWIKTSQTKTLSTENFKGAIIQVRSRIFGFQILAVIRWSCQLVQIGKPSISGLADNTYSNTNLLSQTNFFKVVGFSLITETNR